MRNVTSCNQTEKEEQPEDRLKTRLVCYLETKEKSFLGTGEQRENEQ